MNKRKTVMAVLLASALTLSTVSATVVHAQEEPVDQKDESSVVTENDSNDPHEHHFSVQLDSSKTDENYHYYVCDEEGCSETKQEAHNPVWRTEDYASDTKGGYKIQVCTVCEHSVGDEVYIPPLSVAPVFSTTRSAWDGDSDLVFRVMTQGLRLDVSYSIALKNGDEIGSTPVSYNPSEVETGNMTLSASDIAIKDRLSKFHFTWNDVKEIIFYATFVKTDEDNPKNATHIIDRQISLKPDYTSTLTDGSGVTMKLPENAPDDLKLNVKVSNGTAEKTAVEKVVKVAGDKIKTFDLSLLSNGQVYEYNGQFTSTVSLPIPDGWDMNRLALYYFNEDTKEVTPVAFRIDKENGMLVFDTNHFSKYVLVQKDTTTGETETTTDTLKDTTTNEAPKITDNPKTGDVSPIAVYAVLLLAAGGFLVLAGKKKRM